MGWGGGRVGVGGWIRVRERVGQCRVGVGVGVG